MQSLNNIGKLAKVFFFIAIFCFLISNAIAQGPPPPPSGGHGQSDNQPGGGAPVGSGLVILLGLGAAYGGKKVLDLNRKKDR